MRFVSGCDLEEFKRYIIHACRVEGSRKEFNQPRWGEWFEYLYNEMQKREQRLQQTQQ